jgi:hypothetical protein
MRATGGIQEETPEEKIANLTLSQGEINELNKLKSDDLNKFSIANTKLLAILLRDYYTLSSTSYAEFIVNKFKELGITSYKGRNEEQDITELAEFIKNTAATRKKTILQYIKFADDAEIALPDIKGKSAAEFGDKRALRYLESELTLSSGLAVQEINVEMLNIKKINIFKTNITLEELEEVVYAFNNGDTIPLDYFDIPTQDAIKQGAIIELVDNLTGKFDSTGQPIQFHVRQEIMYAVNRYENIGAQSLTQDHDDPDAKQTTAEIPMVFLVVCGAERNIHVVLVLYIRTKMYTLGYGYFGETAEDVKKNDTSSIFGLGEIFHFGEGSAYSPDPVFNASRDNRVVAGWVITPTILKNIEKDLQNCTSLHVDCKIKIERQKERVRFTAGMMPNDKKYATTSGIGHTGKENCVSWVHSILGPERIRCTTFGFANPGACTTTTPIKGGIVDFLNAIEKDDVPELLTYLSPTPDSELVPRKSNSLTPEEAEARKVEAEAELAKLAEEMVSNARKSKVLPSVEKRRLLTEPKGGGKLKTKKSTFRKSTFRKSTFRKSGAKYRKTQKRRKSTFKKSGAKHKK